MARGKVKPSKRQRIFERDGHRCVFVNSRGRRCRATENLTIEHILPRSLGGKNNDDNLETLCAFHNHLRGVRHQRSMEEMKWGMPWETIKRLNKWTGRAPSPPLTQRIELPPELLDDAVQ